MRKVKVCVVGPKGCGKSSMVRALLGLPFEETYKQTIEPKIYKVRAGKTLFEIWDCPDWLDLNVKENCGEGYCENAGIIIYCFDLASKENSKACSGYIQPAVEGSIIIVCGLRSDIQIAPLEHLSNDWHCVTSSKYGVGLVRLESILREV